MADSCAPELSTLLATVPPEVRAFRLNLATILMAHSIANRRTRAAAGRPPKLSERRFVDELLAAMAAVLRSGPAA